MFASSQQEMAETIPKKACKDESLSAPEAAPEQETAPIQDGETKHPVEHLQSPL